LTPSVPQRTMVRPGRSGMVDTPTDQRQLTLPALLAQRARRASDGRLTLDAAGGLIAAAALMELRPPAWPVLFSAAMCFLAFGVWGICDRALRETAHQARPRPLVRALRAAAAALGVLGGIALVATGMALMIGRWIS
jgi:hypothetical protein